MPIVSIIIPVYNIEEKKLRQCIESVCSQTLKQIEIIIIDDGSTNNAGEVCQEYANRDDRIVIIHKKNEGVAIARNAGLKQASGEWITFVDADDWCEDSMCEDVYTFAVNNNADIVIFDNFFVKNNNTILRNHFFDRTIDSFSISQKQEAEMKTMIKTHPFFSFQPPYNMLGGTWCKFINHNFLRKSGVIFEPELLRSQDIIFYLYLFEKAERIAYLNSPYYYYRYSDTSISRKYRPDAYNVMKKVLIKQSEFIKFYEKPHEFYEVFMYSILSVISICTHTDLLHPDNKISLRKKTLKLKEIINEEPINSMLLRDDIVSLDFGRKVRVSLLKHKWCYVYLLMFKYYNYLKK